MTKIVPTTKDQATQADVDAIVAALQALEASATSANAHANPDGSVPRREITLSALTAALHEVGVNLVSPIEILNREQAIADAEKAALEAAKREQEIHAQEEICAKRANNAAEARRVIVEEAMMRLDKKNTSSKEGSATAVPPDVDAVTDSGSVISLDSDGGSGNGNGNADVKNSSGVVAAADFDPTNSDISDEVLKGFVCISCNSYNLLRPSKESWYVVTSGRKVGVFQDWCIVAPLVTGFSRAVFKRYNSEAEATRAFQDAVALGRVNY